MDVVVARPKSEPEPEPAEEEDKELTRAHFSMGGGAATLPSTLGGAVVPSLSQQPILVGTSGFSYSHWRSDGKFYPRNLPAGDELRYFATCNMHFCEINSSFYAFPKTSAMDKWAAQTNDAFRITLKMNRSVTHEHRLAGNVAMNMAHDFATQAAKHLKSRCGPILLQTPPSLRRDDASLDEVLSKVREGLDENGASEVGIACEFRHISWHVREVYTILQRHRATIVDVVEPWVNADGTCASTGRTPMLRSNKINNQLCYIRMAHSESQEKAVGYTEFGDAQLKALSQELVSRWRTIRGSLIYVAFMNDLAAKAPANARKLIQMLRSQSSKEEGIVPSAVMPGGVADLFSRRQSGAAGAGAGSAHPPPTVPQLSQQSAPRGKSKAKSAPDSAIGALFAKAAKRSKHSHSQPPSSDPPLTLSPKVVDAPVVRSYAAADDEGDL